jgi:hypothetical protein
MYIDRRFPVYNSTVLLSWALYLVVVIVMNGLNDAAKFGAMLLVSSTLLTHLFGRIRVSSLPFPQGQAFAFQGYRAFRLVRKRFIDVSSVMNMRSRTANFATFKKLTLWASAIPGVMLDLLGIVRGSVLLVESRGGIPRSQVWLSGTEEARLMTLFGDIALLGVVVFAMSFGAAVLLPFGTSIGS